MNKRIAFILKIALSALLIIWFLSRTDLPEIAALFVSISFVTLFAAVILDIAGVFIDTYEWQVILPGQNFVDLLEANFVSKYYGLVLPGQIAGEVGKVWHLKKLGEQKVGEIVASVAVDKLTGLAGAVFLVGSIGAILSSIALPPVVFWFFFFAGLCLSLIFFVFVRYETFDRVLKRMIDATIGRFARLRTLCTKLKEMVEATRIYSRQGWRVAAAVALGALYQGVSIAIVMIVANAVGVHIGFFDWCWIFSLLSVILLLPISFGGLGIRDASLAGLLALFAVPLEKALAISLSLFGLQIILALIGLYVSLMPIKGIRSSLS